jgi:transposase
MDRILTEETRSSLMMRHRKERDKRIADRIKAVLLRDDGYTYPQIAQVLFLSDESARLHVEDFLKEEKLTPQSGGSISKLDIAQSIELIAHLESKTYLYVKDIAAYIEEKYKVKYSVSGVTQWLERHEFSYHQPAVVPAKANEDAQKKHIKQYDSLLTNLLPSEEIVFMDSVHPTHEVRVARGWIRKGVRKPIATNGSGKRMNIVGALDLSNMSVYNKEYKTINATSIVKFFEHLLFKMPKKSKIYVILDGARYHKSIEVKNFVKNNPKITLIYLPAYSPNLNAIEVLWKIMHEHVTYNKHYASFKCFTESILNFFSKTVPIHAKNWRDRLCDNFQTLNSPILDV